jgi:hypothetical protein
MGRIVGTLLDEDGNPIPGALVTVTTSSGEFYTTKTQLNGSFNINAPQGTLTWEITISGFQTLRGSIEVKALEIVELDLSDLPMRKEDDGGSPLIFISAGILLLIIIIAAILLFLWMRRKGLPDSEDERNETGSDREMSEGGPPADEGIENTSQEPTFGEKAEQVEDVFDNFSLPHETDPRAEGAPQTAEADLPARHDRI